MMTIGFELPTLGSKPQAVNVTKIMVRTMNKINLVCRVRIDDHVEIKIDQCGI